MLVFVSALFTPQGTTSFSPLTTPTHLATTHIVSSSICRISLKGNEGQEPGIVEVNSPSPVKTKGKVQISDMVSAQLSRKKTRFERPPERKSGYYASRVHVLEDGHRLGFDEFYVAENEDDLVVCE